MDDNKLRTLKFHKINNCKNIRQRPTFKKQIFVWYFPFVDISALKLVYFLSLF